MRQVLLFALLFSLIFHGPVLAKQSRDTSPEVGSFCDQVFSIPRIECEALVALYDSTIGPGWINSTGWLIDTDPCNWYEVGCSGGHVETLHLENNNLVGVIAPELGNIDGLRILNLQNNALVGGIPWQLGQISNLLYLWLNGNNLAGGVQLSLMNIPIQIQQLHFQNTLICEHQHSEFQAWLAMIPDVQSTGVLCPVLDELQFLPVMNRP